MKPDYFAANSALAIIKTPSSITANANSAGFDARGYVGNAAFLLSALNTAGTNPTMAIKLQASDDADLIGAITGTRTGTGTITEVVALADAVTEAITITFTSATDFGVVGATSGTLATGVVGTKYTSAQVEFLVTAGGTAFQANDTFIIAVTARTWADVTGVDFTGLTTGVSIQRVSTDLDKLGRFLRFAFNIGGTVSPAYTLSIAMLAMQ